MISSKLKESMAIAVLILPFVLLLSSASFAHDEQPEEEIIIVARNYLFTDEISGAGVVIGSKKGRFQPTQFNGTSGTAVLLFMYNRISRDTCIQLISKLYERELDEVEPKVDQVLAFLKDNNLVLKSKFPNPSRNYGMNKFRPEE